MFDRYKVQLTLIRDQLATNPSDPNVLDTHILERQRKLILEKSQLNSQINKYLDQLPISKERGEEEVSLLFAKLEQLTGYQLTPEEKVQALTGDLKSLRETLSSMDLKGTTVFFWNKEKNRPCIGDHMILGFLKAAAEALVRCLPKTEQKAGTILKSAAYTASTINQHVRVDEQFITFDNDLKMTSDGEPFYLQRSLRAKTAQGDRVALAKSEVVQAGSKLDFTLKVLEGSPMREEHLVKLFSYGELSGLGQWRNAGWGQFKFTITKVVI